MVDETINLRLFRKQQQRSKADKNAARNRVKFGFAKGARTLAGARQALDAARLDGHRLDGESEPKLPHSNQDGKQSKSHGTNDDQTGT